MYYGAPAVSAIVSVRVPKKLKEEMDRLRDRVNWSEEIRRFLERRVRELQRKLVLEEARRIIETLPEAPQGTAARYVREDRDSR